MVFKHVLCGGTFDRLHKGHKAFLQFAFSKGQQVTIGLTSDAYIEKYKPNQGIQPFLERKKELEAFLRSQDVLSKTTIVAIDNPFDETLTQEASVALLVSSETYESGQRINQEREKNHLPKLPLIVFPIIFAEDGRKISSQYIRQGMMTEEGILTGKQLPSDTIVIPSDIRELLHKPFGTLFYDDIPQEYVQNPATLVTVGDVTTKRIHDMGIQQKLSVIDFSVERKKTFTSIDELGFTGEELSITLDNPAGHLQSKTWQTLADVLKKISAKQNCIVEVAGEEDLLVIPLVILLPIGFTILYGQPGEGVVAVEVTHQLQEQIRTLVAQLMSSNTPGY